MSNETGSLKGERVLSSLGLARSEEERLLGKIITGHTGWFLALFVLLLYLLSSELRTNRPEVLWWLGFYVAYQVLLEVLSRLNPGFYETAQFRMVRVQLTIAFSSVLIGLTYGSQSPFWFVYLWPIFATAIYFESRWVTFGIYCESAALYLLASVLAAGGFAGIRFEPLVVNISIMLVLSAVLHLLVESARMYEAAEVEIGHLEALQRIQEEIETAVTLQDVLDRVLQGAVELVEARDGSLMLLEGDELRFRARFGKSLPEGKIERSFKTGEGVAGWVAKSGEPYVCQDTETDSHFSPIIAGMPIRSLVSVPIVSHGVSLGVINVDSEMPSRFSEADAQLVLLLANQATWAIERAELWDDLGQIGEKALSGAQDLYDQIVRAVHRLTRCPAAVWQVDEQNRAEATMRSHTGLREEYARTRVLDLDQSITGKAIKTGQPIEIEDIQEHPDVAPETKVEANLEGWESMLIVPLLGGSGQAVGTISIYSRVRRRFAPWEIDQLRTFASQAGVSVQNAERLRTMQRLSEVGRSLTTLQESPEMLQDTLERIATIAVQELGADIVDLYEYRADRKEFILPPVRVGERRVPDLIPEKILPDDVVSKIAHTGDTIFTSDAQTHPVLTGEWESAREGRPEQRFVFREEIVSSAAVPMKVGEEVLGVMFASYRQKREFDTDLELCGRVEVFAQQGAIAIRNARLAQSLKERADEVRLLQQISTRLTETLDLDKILPTLVEEATRLTQTQSGVVHVLDDTGERFLHSYGYPEAFIHPHPRMSDEGYTSLIVREKKQIVVDHAQTDTQVSEALKELKVESFVGTPLKLEGKRVVGVLYVNDTAVRIFTDGELSLLQALADQAAVAIENARLFAALDHRARQLEQLHAVTTAISAEPPDLDKVLRLIVDRLGDVLPGASCAVRLYDPETAEFESQVGTGVLEDLVGRPPRAGGTSHLVIKTGVPRYLEGDALKAPPDGGPAVRDEIVDQGVKAVAYLPLISDGRAIGILYVDLVTPHHFSPSDKQILELFADQAAIAIENTRLYEQRSTDIAALQKVNEAITTASWEDIAVLIALVAKDLTQAEYAGLWRVEENRLVPGAMYGRELMAIPELPIPERPKDATSMNGWVATTGEPYVCFDVGNDPYYQMWRDEVQSSMAVPMRLKGQVVGTVCVESIRAQAFSDYHADLLQSLADQAAIALGNANFIVELDEKVNQLEAVTEIGRTVSSLGIDQVLDLVYEKMSNLIKLEDAQVQFALFNEAEDEVTFPLAMEKDDGQVIDVVRLGKRDSEYREVGEDETVKQFRPRKRGTRFGLTEYVLDFKQPVSLREEFQQPPRPSSQDDEESFVLHLPAREDVPMEEESREVKVWRRFGRRNRQTNSWLGVPMLVQNRAIGIISVQSLGDEPLIDPDNLIVLETVANQAAVAIENAVLYHTVENLNQEQRDTIAELESAQSEIANKERALVLTSVAADFVHKMNNLAGTIPNWVSLTRRLLSPSAGEDKRILYYLDKISEDARFLLREAGRLRDPLPKPEEVLVQDLVNSIIEQMELIASPEIEFAVLGEPSPGRVWAVRPQLSDAIFNVVDNAVKSISGAGQVLVSMGMEAESGRDHVRIDVSDTGCGINPERLATIFEFGATYRGDGKSLGYGLWRARNIFEGLGGSIHATSVVGEGSTFTLRLPVVTDYEDVKSEE